MVNRHHSIRNSSVRHLPSCLMLVGLMLLASPAMAVEEPMGWRAGIGDALDEAARRGAPVMVDVWAVWCQPCLEMDRTTYRDPRVLERVAGVVPVKVNADLQEQFIARYQVDAYPTLLILDGTGRVVARERGLVSARRLAGLLESVGGGYAAYLDSVDRLDDPAAAERVADYLVQLKNTEGAEQHLRRSIKALKRDLPRRQSVELRLAELHLENGAARRALKTFEKLDHEAHDTAVRGRALYGLVRVQRELGDRSSEADLLGRLRAEFPELADLAENTTAGR